MKESLRCLVCFAALSHAQTQQVGKQAHLNPLTPAQARAAADKVVRAKTGTDATPDTEQGQSFVLRAPGAEDLTLIAGELSLKDPVKPPTIQMQCGIFLLNGKSESHYIPAVGPDFKPYSWCEQLSAMGTTDDTGPRPRLIAEFFLRALSGDHYNMPFVLVWDKATSTYQVDPKASGWLVSQHGGSTIAGARQLLPKYKP